MITQDTHAQNMGVSNIPTKRDGLRLLTILDALKSLASIANDTQNSELDNTQNVGQILYVLCEDLDNELENYLYSK